MYLYNFPINTNEEHKTTMKEDEKATTIENAYEKERVLGEDINDLIDRIFYEIDEIKFRICDPIDNFTYEDMKILVENIDWKNILSFPLPSKQMTLFSAALQARQKGKDISDELMEKVAGLPKEAAIEVEYRIYVLGNMKQVLANHINLF